MGYPVQDHAPQITVSGVTYAAGAFLFDNPVLSQYKIGLYKKSATEWVEVEARGLTPEQLLADIQSQGGIVNYANAVRDYINTLLAKWCVGPIPVPGEPTTPAEAMAAVSSHINAMTIRIVNGIPVLG